MDSSSVSWSHELHRYVLWAMQKYRLGSDPTEFAHGATPKKKIRGYVPAQYSILRLVTHAGVTGGDLRCKMGNA
jgi:hypothetical protein